MLGLPVTIVRVRVYYVHFFVFFVLRHWCQSGTGSYTEDEPSCCYSVVFTSQILLNTSILTTKLCSKWLMSFRIFRNEKK